MNPSRDYLERTIATVRIHREADNCWPQWANIFADEIERLWGENELLRRERDSVLRQFQVAEAAYDELFKGGGVNMRIVRLSETNTAEENARLLQKVLDEDKWTDEGKWTESRWMRLLDWIEARTTGKGSWPWGMIWLRRGFAFHFASGESGFVVTFPLPRMLPGFVKPYQVQELRTREGRRGTNLRASLPLYPPGLPHAYRTRRARKIR